MKRILITGARAPAALDLMRSLSGPGIDIYAADSVRYPLSRVSNKIKQYFFISSPNHNVYLFMNDLKWIIEQYKIDVLIPTCEEIFFISKYKECLEENCVVFCDSFDKLSTFHNKYKFLEAAKNCGVLLPKTQLIVNQSDLDRVENVSEKVFKPIFSRFASNTLIRPQRVDLQKLSINLDTPWIAQEYISGDEYCTYSIAVNGKLQVHICYRPTYRAGLGSGIHFTPALNEKIRAFVSNFVVKHNYNGQIAFDFMQAKDRNVYVLECNPRSTSGIHCLPTHLEWANILRGDIPRTITTNQVHKMISLAMLTFGLKYLFSRNGLTFLASFMKARDCVWRKCDMSPSFFQLVSLGEIVFKSIRHRSPLKTVATADIEWNGEEL